MNKYDDDEYITSNKSLKAHSNDYYDMLCFSLTLFSGFLLCQLFYYYAELPQGCNNFNGPHSLLCLKSLWSEGGCVEGGLKNPNVLSEDELNMLINLTIQ